MVVQKSGMVSADNPFSNSGRYYNNPYDSKRTAPSVANYSKNYGEGEREHYMRSGVQSKNNPFSNNQEYYENHKGKKVEEKVERP